MELVQALAGTVGFQLPTALSQVWHGKDFSAAIQRCVPGAAHTPRAGDAVRLRAVPEALPRDRDIAALTGPVRPRPLAAAAATTCG